MWHIRISTSMFFWYTAAASALQHQWITCCSNWFGTRLLNNILHYSQLPETNRLLALTSIGIIQFSNYIIGLFSTINIYVGIQRNNGWRTIGDGQRGESTRHGRITPYFQFCVIFYAASCSLHFIHCDVAILWNGQ